jgi:hypothetical protein
MKNVGAPWLGRSLVSGRPRQSARTRSRIASVFIVRADFGLEARESAVGRSESLVDLDA